MVRQEQIWNVIPLFILFREAIEASIIVSVLISFVRRMNARQLERQVWWGVGLAGALSIVFGVIFIVIYYVLSKNLFQGRSQLIFKACVSAVACLMITFLAFAMLRFMGWEAKWQRRLKLMAEKEIQLKDKVDAAEVGARISNDSGSGAGSADAKMAMAMDLTTPSLDVKMAMAMDSTTPSLDAKMAMSLDAATFSQEMQPAEPNKHSKWDPRSWVGAVRAKVPKRFGGTFDGQVTTIEIDETELSWAARNAFFIAVFLTVLREGLESVIFLAGVGNTIPTAIILPGIVGLICGILFGVFLYYCGKTVKDVKWLFIGMALVLFFIAAGQAEMFADFLMKAGAFGVPYMSGPLVVSAGPAMAFGDGDEFYDVSGEEDGYRALDIRPWWMRELWDVSGCCADTDDKNKFLSLARAIFGYNAKPAFVDVIAYCGYWVLAIAFACYKFEKGTLFDADYKHTQMKRAEAEAAADEAATKTAAATTPVAAATC